MNTVKRVFLAVIFLICLVCSEGYERRGQHKTDRWEYKYVHAITMIEGPLGACRSTT